MLGGGRRTYVEVLGKTGQLQGCPLARAPRSSVPQGHARTAASIYLGQENAARGTSVDMSISFFSHFS